MIRIKTKPYKLGEWTILRLPDEASAKLPSRGQVMVRGTLNGIDFQTPLEPDGNWSHWFRIPKSLFDAAHVDEGAPASLSIEPVKEWPEPEIPADIQKALATDAKAHDLWQRVTPMARWEWIRWIRGTSSDETRKHRIEVACSKLRAGERRPCCWNRNACSEPAVSKGGVLLGPDSLKHA